MNTPPPPPTDAGSSRRPLYRRTDDRMIAGVASGIAAYLDVDVTVVRISIAVLSVFGGAGVVLYIAGWLLMPAAGSEQSIASKLTRKARACTQS
jgi:phage shock protein PspC (stress-responsive transcriptional regulator)